MNNQHETILGILSDGKWHCSNEFYAQYIADPRTRLCELQKKKDEHGHTSYHFDRRKCQNLTHKHKGGSKEWMLLNVEKRPEEPKRESGGFQRLVFGQPLGKPKRHFFQSDTHPGKKYCVVEFATFSACDCPSYQFRKSCKHIEDVKAGQHNYH